jgi:hypothetical protein
MNPGRQKTAGENPRGQVRFWVTGEDLDAVELPCQPRSGLTRCERRRGDRTPEDSIAYARATTAAHLGNRRTGRKRRAH